MISLLVLKINLSYLECSIAGVKMSFETKSIEIGFFKIYLTP